MKKSIISSFVILVIAASASVIAAGAGFTHQIAYSEHASASQTRPNISLPGQELVMEETFEGDFPTGLWTILEGSSDVYWDDVNCASYEGTRCAWCAGGGSDAPTPCTEYNNDMFTWMIWGPFDLSDATAGYYDFYFWTQAETGYDALFYGASIDGNYFYGYTVDTDSDWTYVSVDFSSIPEVGNLLGQPDVWIGFEFISDSSNTYGGAYVDYIDVYKTVSDNPTPTPNPDVPSITIDMPTTYVHPYDSFYINENIDVPSSPLYSVNLFCVLDVYGALFFWPSWTTYPEWDWTYYDTIDVGSWYVEILPAFTWPDTGGGSASGLYLYGLMLDETLSYVIGNYDVVSWGYGP
jgi:hypothetical protein